MARTKPPRLPDAPPAVLTDDGQPRILEACERDKTFAGRRDEVVLRVFMDTWARRAEVLGLEDVDLDSGRLTVTGKGSRTHDVQVGVVTIPIHRYHRARGKDPAARRPELWLGRKGPLRESGRGRTQQRAWSIEQCGASSRTRPIGSIDSPKRPPLRNGLTR
jgi:integrase